MRSVLLLLVIQAFVHASDFQYPLYKAEPAFYLNAGLRDGHQISRQIIQHYTDVESRWKTKQPISDTALSQTAATEVANERRFQYLPESRGAREERSDFTSNAQPGAPAFVGPSGEPELNGRLTNASVDPLNGGNFCDEGVPNLRCVVNQPLRFPGNYTISGSDTIPFSRSADCTCFGSGCKCTVVFDAFMPEWAKLSWARISASAEMGGFVRSWHSSKVDDTLIQGECIIPPSCAVDGRSTRNDLVLCDPSRGQFFQCFSQIDVTVMAMDGYISVEVLAGSDDFPIGSVTGDTLNARIHFEGEYAVHGVLDVKAGGGLYCEFPNCTLVIENFRWLNVHSGAVISAQNIIIRVPALVIAGTISAMSLQIVAGSLALNRTGELVTADREFHSRLDVDARPANHPMALKYMFPGCNIGCDPCKCLLVDGKIWFTRVVITGLGLHVGPHGHVSADALGHRAGEGPGRGMSSPFGGGGGGGGGNGAAACQAGAGGGGAGYGLAIAPSDTGYCAGQSIQASIQGNTCLNVVATDLGSGGGHGLVQGGQGGGAIRVHTDVEVVIEGIVSARGEDSACITVFVPGNATAQAQFDNNTTTNFQWQDGRQGYTVSQPGGGAGGGGTVWITAPRVVGSGEISTMGGSSNRSCDIVRVISSGGAGGGGRVALDYLTSSSSSLRVNVRGGLSRCTAGGAGTAFHSKMNTLIIDNGDAFPMTGQPGNFGKLIEPPMLLSAYTPWTTFSAPAQAARLRACAYHMNYSQPFGCDQTLLNYSLLGRIFVKLGAVSEFPQDDVQSIVIENGGVMMATSRSRNITSYGNVTVQSGGVLGCISCAGSREAANDLAGCNDTCPSWSLLLSRGDLSVKSGGKIMGTDIKITIGGSAFFGYSSWAAPSDWRVLSSLSLVAKDNITVHGTVWMSSVSMRSSYVWIGERGWITSDALGYLSDTGPGAGMSSLTGGGGGGGHGGTGAEGCYDFPAGGLSYGDAVAPQTFGSGGGAGASLPSQEINVSFANSTTILQRPVPVAYLPENVSVRQLRRTGSMVFTSSELCILRGSRKAKFDSMGNVLDRSVPMSDFGTACPSGFQGSSLPDWCCSGFQCDCVFGFLNYHPGGRGGGQVKMNVTNILVNDGVISTDGEGSGCLGSSRSEGPLGMNSASPKVAAYAIGGAGAGGSITILADTVSGGGLFRANGGKTNANCSITRSGGGGGGGRISAVYKNIGHSLRLEAAGGLSDGCPSGGAGTIFFDLNKTIVADNLHPIRLSAVTPYPASASGIDVTVVSSGGANLGFPSSSIGRVFALRGGALVPTTNSSILVSREIVVSMGGLLGCLDCPVATDGQNMIPGCHSGARNVCPPFKVIANSMTFSKGGRLKGCSVELQTIGLISIDEGSNWLTSDQMFHSILQAQADFFQIEGDVRFSSIQFAGAHMHVGQSGWVSSNALGPLGGYGSTAGMSHRMGGGGGGNGGNGAQGCYLESLGGKSTWTPDDAISSPWSFGGAGGHGGGNSVSIGGRGGGRIRISLTGNLTMSGVLSADGESTHCLGVVRSWYIRNNADKQFIAGAHGGGAGAGGSIWVIAKTIFGEGAMYARGGSSFCRSHLAWPGGGGGGGRIAVITTEKTLLGLNLNASGGKSGWDADQADRSGTGRITGCAAGGAGTIFIRAGNISTVIVDNGIYGRLSAKTPFPSLKYLDRIVVRRGAVLQFPNIYNSSNCTSTSNPSTTTQSFQRTTTSAAATSSTSAMIASTAIATSSRAATSSTSAGSTALTSATTSTGLTSSNTTMLTSTAAFNTTGTTAATSSQTSYTTELFVSTSASFNSTSFFSTFWTTTIAFSNISSSTTSSYYFTTTTRASTSTVGTTSAPTASTSSKTITSSASTTVSTTSTSTLTSNFCVWSSVIPEVLGDVLVEEQSALVPVSGGQLLAARSIIIDRGGIIGCLSCSDSITAQNAVPGCSGTCPSFIVQADNFVAMRGGRVMGIDVNMTLFGNLSAGVGSGFVASDLISKSNITVTASNLDLHGFVRFTTVNITVLANAEIHRSGRIDSTGLGAGSDEGVGAGIASNLGGGGGGYGGHGDDACEKTTTGDTPGKGGASYVQDGVPPENSWLLGSGGGHGNAVSWNSTVSWNEYQQQLSYPSGGLVPCPFDRGCDDPQDPYHQDLGRQPEYVPTFEVTRSSITGSYRVRNADALCWPRGAAVDVWASPTVLGRSAIPSHPKACAPGWSGSNLPGFCCLGQQAGPHPDHMDWSDRRACDCSPFAIGQNPGGAGGGRATVRIGNILILDGTIAADGESTGCSGSNSNPGGAGSGGTVHVYAPIINGSGKISAKGGDGVSGCEATSAGGGGGGGFLQMAYGIISPRLDISVIGGKTSCADGRIGRFCDPVNIGDCNFTFIGDEFDSTHLHRFWKWANEPPMFCVAGLEYDARMYRNSSARQGRCWDVSVSRLGWLRVVPSNVINLWTNDTAHRAYITLPSRTPFDVSTHVQLMNNDSSCVTAGIFARGVLNSIMDNCPWCNMSNISTPNCSSCQEFEWVTVGILDSGEGSRLQWNTRGITMQDVHGMRDRARVTDVYLRLVKDGNGVFQAFWKKSEIDDWSPFAPNQQYSFDTLEIGLFAGQCEEYGNATVDFEYFRDNSNIALDKTYGWRGQSGIVSEVGTPPDLVINDTTHVETAASFASALEGSAPYNRSLAIFQLGAGSFKLASLRMRNLYVMLRGPSKLDFQNAWNATSSARFITSQRYVDDFGEPRDTSLWNGTSWVPKVVEYIVSVRPNSQRTQYVFYVDGVETPRLTLSRPGSYERPNLYIFTLDPTTFNASAALPSLNSSALPTPLDGSGTASPHPFLITTAPNVGFRAIYRVGTRRSGATSGKVLLRVAASAPDTLYYESGSTGGMGGVIDVVDPLLASAKLLPFRRLLATSEAEDAETVSGSNRASRRAGSGASKVKRNLRSRLDSFYRVHNKEKLGHLDDMVREWASKEDELNVLLKKRYGTDLPAFEALRGADEEASVTEQGDIPKLVVSPQLIDNETTILSNFGVTVDCGGGNFFETSGNVTPSLLLVDISIHLKSCNFSGAKGAYSVIIQHSMVRFSDCVFSSSVGGIQIDSAFVEAINSTFSSLYSSLAGSAIRVGTEMAWLAGHLRLGGSLTGIHRMSSQVYISQSTFIKCSAGSGGAVWVGRGTFYCADCTFQRNHALNFGGALLVDDFGTSVMSNSRIERSSAREGGAFQLRGGTAQFSFCNFTGNVAGLHGGVGFLHPNTYSNPLVQNVGSESHTISSPVSSAFLRCSFVDNKVVGSANDPGAGGAFYLDGAAASQFDGCEFRGNAALSADSEGGCFAVRDSGVLYVRDSVVANSSAAYGGALRIYTQTSALVSVVFDNVTIRNNAATRFGAVLAGYSHRRARLTPFLHAAGRYLFATDPQGFRANTKLRFGFNADPYLEPYAATVAPDGTRLAATNPYEPRHFTLTLPGDGRLTDQWPFYATGERYKGYYSDQTTPGQKAASGGLAFLLSAEGSRWGGEVQDARRPGLTGGMCAFKDCNVYENGPPGLGVCYFHAEEDLQQCLDEKVLL